MKISTKNSRLGKTLDRLKVNKRFSKYTEVKNINHNKKTIVSPVDATVAKVGRIDENGNIISKHKKKVKLNLLLGSRAKDFVHGKYINFYLSPKNKHFWICPYEGKFTFVQKNEGKAILPVFIGLENWMNVSVFHKAIKKNASIGAILHTEEFDIAMIAVGSLNVNRVHSKYVKNKEYKKGDYCGHFSLGSSFLLVFSKEFKVLVKKGDCVKLGNGIIKIP